MNRKKKREVSETDNANCDELPVRHQSISIQQWYEYAKAGIDLPVKIRLYGNSMEPLIRCKKDIVTVVPLKRELLPGDIVLFKRADGVYVVHRVYRLISNGNQIQTWGDNCNYPDLPIKREHVLGILVCVERNGKKTMLDNKKQRDSGVKWMNGTAKRKFWFVYKYFNLFYCKAKGLENRVKKYFACFRD